MSRDTQNIMSTRNFGFTGNIGYYPIFWVAFYAMIFKIKLGRVRYRQKYRVAGWVRGPVGHCLRIIDVNAFGNRAKGNSGLYATICRINHSCAPNACHISDHLGVMEVNAMMKMTGRMMMMTGKHGKITFRNKSGK